MRRDERRSPTGPPFISFRLSSEGGLGAPGTEVEGFAGFGAPSPCRQPVENPPGVGAPGTEVEGLAGLGAPGTEVQGFAGYRAPSPCRRSAGNSAILIELSISKIHNPICLEN